MEGSRSPSSATCTVPDDDDDDGIDDDVRDDNDDDDHNIKASIKEYDSHKMIDCLTIKPNY